MNALIVYAHPETTSFSAALKDFSDTAALISNLDLGISADTVVAHLAGRAGDAGLDAVAVSA